MAGAYSQQTVQVQGKQLLNEKTRTLDKGYSLVGDVHSALFEKQDVATFRVMVAGLADYTQVPIDPAHIRFQVFIAF